MPIMRLLTKFSFLSTMIFFLLQNSATAQEHQNSSPPGAASGSGGPVNRGESKDIAPAAAMQPVITVHRSCIKDAGKDDSNARSCTTVITRERFETLVTALNPDGQAFPPNARKTLAKTYADYVAIETAARQSGMEDTAQFRELMDWSRLRTIADLYRRRLQDQYSTPAKEEIDAYFRQHVEEFERVKLIRVLVPRSTPAAADKPEFDKKAWEAANTAREQLTKRVDPIQVQKDAYATLGLAAPPAVDLGSRARRDLIPEEAAEVFSLNVGEASHVQTEPGNYVVYEVESKNTVAEDQVKKEISRAIYEQKFKEAMKAVLNAAPVEFDEQYLGADKALIPAQAPVRPASPTPH